MGHKYSREQFLDAALDAAIEDGLSRLTFGRLANRLGVNDRNIVYYFPTKDDLIVEVLMMMGLQVQETLAAAFSSTATDHIDLLGRAWPILAKPAVDPLFGLFFEASGLATAGREPYRTLGRQLVQGWVAWLSGFFEGSADERRVEAETAVAMLDGLLLLRQLAGPTAANRAATRLGIR